MDFTDVPFLKKKQEQQQPTKTKNELKGNRLTSTAIGKEAISAFRLRKSGNSTIVTIPDHVLKLLEAAVGDYVEYVYLPDEKIVVMQIADPHAKKKKKF
ncbi:AbrB/MazE/SpoVT family DNA-binding domain-containing protein [Enterococcus timonensis]|uniref:AbrB/MazE/SpoVT family DNA-binding domain-containing protein n=1 Tax=Enterococcus timonensis TaxID=1852364 RepID=UPI0008D96C65|nr:hypothetical protein [Enterococcus timonensis]